MNAGTWRIRSRVLSALAFLLGCSTPLLAQHHSDESAQRWWAGAGLGAAVVHSLEPAPSAGRNALAASLEFGYQVTPQWGLGLELGVVAPAGGCAELDCAATPALFAPNFARLFTFGEYRPHDSGWHLRAGAGVSRFCYARHWSDSAWGWGDTVNLLLSVMLEQEPFDDTDSRSGGYRCDARMNALGGALSVGYDWPVAESAPLSMGVRLSAEAAGFGAASDVRLPAFRHRAVMLTLHLNIR